MLVWLEWFFQTLSLLIVWEPGWLCQKSFVLIRDDNERNASVSLMLHVQRQSQALSVWLQVHLA